MKVRILEEVRYPAEWCKVAPLRPGDIIDAVPADNLPDEGVLWAQREDLKRDPYGIALYPGDYEVLPD